MLEGTKWKKIPNRMQNTYDMMKKFKHLPTQPLHPIRLRKKLPPLPSSLETSQSDLSSYERPMPAKSQIEEELNSLIQDEIKSLIKTSLKQYPQLESRIANLQKEKIHCKCSVFSKNIFSLDRVHGFSSVACASEYCINKILDDPQENTEIITKNPEYYSLIPQKSERKEVNKDLILYEKDLYKVNDAVNYMKNTKNSEQEYKLMYSEYIKPPEGFKIPNHSKINPNFSVPKPRSKRLLS